MRVGALFSKSTSILGLVEQTHWKMPFFTEWIVASSFERILLKPSIHSTAVLPLGLLVLDAFLSFYRVKELGEGFDFVIYVRLLISWRKLQLSPSEHCPLAFLRPTISWSFLFSLLCPLILNHDVGLISSISGFKILNSYILLDTSFHHRLQSLIIKPCFLLVNIQVIQYQHGLKFS